MCTCMHGSASSSGVLFVGLGLVGVVIACVYVRIYVRMYRLFVWLYACYYSIVLCAYYLFVSVQEQEVHSHASDACLPACLPDSF